MKEYTAPQIVLCDNYQDLHVDPATLEWSVDSEKNQIVMTSCYEQVGYDEYLKERGEDPTDYDDETIMSYRAYRWRPEAVEVLRVDCDPNMVEIVKESVDEEGNQIKTIVTKKQMVAFEIGATNDELKEEMSYHEDFYIYYREVDPGMIAFHKDGRWWFLDLIEMRLVEVEEYDEETGDKTRAFFSCEAIYPLTLERPYVRGEKYEPVPEDFVGGEMEFICEDGNDQYGIKLPYIQNGVILLNRKDWIGRVTDPWTRIERMDGNLTLRQVTDEEGLKKEGIYGGFGMLSICLYEREKESIFGEEVEPDEELEYQWVYGKDRFLRVIQGDTMRLIPAELKYRTMYPEEAKSELLRDWNDHVYGYQGIPFVQRIGDYFVVKKETPVGSRTKTQYRIVFEDGYLDGVWDHVQFLGECDDELYFSVKKDGYWGVIDSVGKVVVPLHFTDILKLYDPGTTCNLLNVECKMQLDEFGRMGVGYILEGGSFVQVIPCEYEKVAVQTMTDFGNDIQRGDIVVEKMGRRAVYDSNGKLKKDFKPIGV